VSEKELALAACDAAKKDRMAKTINVYIDVFAMADGKPDADAIRAEAAERLKAGLKVAKEAYDSSRAIVEETLP
jgi:hypothetical protein